ncbi:MAG: four helix bundle protein [Candidatus Sericytochromatia bacterium]
MIKSYRDLGVWQKAMDLVEDCYVLSGQFPSTEKYGLTNQLRRASVSIPSNIAEGHARQHTKEFLQFLSIAQGSVAELETHLLLAERLRFTAAGSIQLLLNRTEEINRMLTGLKASLNRKPSGQKV